MKKPASLRAAIVATLPDLARDPDNLRIYIDEGKIQSRLGTDKGFAYSYQLTLLLIDFAHDTSQLAIAITEWLRVHQPDLMTPEKDTITFEADILDNVSVDLELKLQLDEMVRVTPKEGGGFDIEYLEMPAHLFDDDLRHDYESVDDDVPPLAGAQLYPDSKFLPNMPPFEG